LRTSSQPLKRPAFAASITPSEAWIAQDLLFTKRGLQHSLNYLAAMKVMAKFMKTGNRQLLEVVYEEHAPVFQRVPLMTKDEVQAVLEVAKSPKAAQAKPEDFFDNSFLQQLEASGFINSLYAR
jgi:hypothetical protein